MIDKNFSSEIVKLEEDDFSLQVFHVDPINFTTYCGRMSTMKMKIGETVLENGFSVPLFKEKDSETVTEVFEAPFMDINPDLSGKKIVKKLMKSYGNDFEQVLFRGHFSNLTGYYHSCLNYRYGDEIIILLSTEDKVEKGVVSIENLNNFQRELTEIYNDHFVKKECSYYYSDEIHDDDLCCSKMKESILEGVIMYRANSNSFLAPVEKDGSDLWWTRLEQCHFCGKELKWFLASLNKEFYSKGFGSYFEWKEFDPQDPDFLNSFDHKYFTREWRKDIEEPMSFENLGVFTEKLYKDKI